MKIIRDRENEQEGEKVYLAGHTVNGNTWYKRLITPLGMSDEWARSELEFRFNRELEELENESI